MDKYVVIVLGGGAGSLARFLVGTAIMEKYAGRFPLGTFAINVSGSLLIGMIMTLLTERLSPHPYWRLGLVVGFLGGYTTFSSFEWETYVTTREGNSWIGLLYVVSSVTAGYVAAWAGAYITGRR
ncbi:MAG TPA: fluoride efflux transporter CrcB [Bryobacteraceae bacterium]|nr:fluoride efflux transporter CrcB [Bryobacteraceae bacterium]